MSSENRDRGRILLGHSRNANVHCCPFCDGTPHHTPKHGSWLNQAEIEIGLFSRQCLGKRRIATIEELTQQANAWNQRTNLAKTIIDWKFTRKKATLKLKYKLIRS